MGELGIFAEDERVELLEGEIIQMPPPGIPHSSSVAYLNRFFVEGVKGRALIITENPVFLDEYSLPQPDLTLLQPPPDDFYFRKARPTAKDALLVIEVADSSLGYDRRRKAPLYAKMGIHEFWIVSLNQKLVTVYRNPASEGYQDVQEFSGNQPFAPQAFPDLVLEAGSIFS